MSMINHCAEILDEAARTATAVPQFGDRLTKTEALQVQAAAFARRLARGEKQVGVKMGFTSHAKMAQMGVDDVIWGRLTDAMQVENGSEISLARFIHPRTEPEIAFLIGRPLAGVVSQGEAAAAIEAVAPALEIIDSRYANFKFSLADVIADNASAAAFVVGPWCRDEIDFADLAMTMSFDGEAVQSGRSSAILGHPIEALMAAARLVAAAEESLKPGDIVFAGAATSAEALRPGIAVEVMVQGLGKAGFSVAP